MIKRKADNWFLNVSKWILALVYAVSAALGLSGCATTAYQGQMPDFTTEDESRDKEIEKFQLQEGFQSPFTLRLGPDKTKIQADSFQPVMQEISSEGWEFREQARIWTFVALGLAAFTAAKVADMRSGDDSEKSDQDTDLIGNLLAIQIGSGLWAAYQMNLATKTYNHDLRERFDRDADGESDGEPEPEFSMTWSWRF